MTQRCGTCVHFRDAYVSKTDGRARKSRCEYKLPFDLPWWLADFIDDITEPGIRLVHPNNGATCKVWRAKRGA